jgi:hypothetical protein
MAEWARPRARRRHALPRAGSATSTGLAPGTRSEPANCAVSKGQCETGPAGRWAVTFERVVPQIAAPAWLGLIATPYRRDGLEGLITMHRGPIRHRMGERAAEDAALMRVLVVHSIDHISAPAEAAGDASTAGPSIQAVFRDLVEDEARTRQIRILVLPGGVDRFILETRGPGPLDADAGRGDVDPDDRGGRSRSSTPTSSSTSSPVIRRSVPGRLLPCVPASPMARSSRPRAGPSSRRRRPTPSRAYGAGSRRHKDEAVGNPRR